MSSAFKELAEKAAELERKGDASAAASCWRRALAYSDNKLNREWCQARADFCGSRLWRGGVN